MVATDQRVVDEIAHIRVEAEVNKMVLQQLVGYLAADLPEPQKAIVHMREQLLERLAPLPSSKATDLLKSRLNQFFATIEDSLVRGAGSPMGQKPN
jgi:hypothetical protein